MDVSSFVELDTKRKDDESGETYTESRPPSSFSKKKRKELEADFSPCVSLKEIGNGTLSQNRHCDALVDERELQTSSSRVMAQRCVDLSLSLSLSLCVSLFFVCSRQIPFGRARRSGHSFLIYLRLEKKRVRRKPKKRADWLGKNLHMRIARAPLVRFVLYHKHQTTDHLKRVLSLPSFATDNNQGSRSRVTRRSQQAGQSTTPRENKTR